MSRFEDFMKTVGTFADKAAKETVKLTDVGVSKVKIKAEEARLCDIYERLGRVAEDYLRSEGSPMEEISAVLSEIDRSMEKIESLKSELKDKKEKYDADIKS